MSIDDAMRAVVREELQKAKEEILSELKNQLGSNAAEGYLSTEAAAEFLGLHPDSVRDAVHSGALKVHRVGRRLRFLRADLHAFAAAGGAVPAADEDAVRILSRKRA